MLAFWLVPCYAKVMAAKVHQFQKTPSGFRVADVTIRLARPDERARWDAIMDQRHYLGFKRFAGRGLRYVFEWHGHWLGLAGWQSGAFKCGPRDRWVGWKRGIQFARLHLISKKSHALWFYTQMVRWGQVKHDPEHLSKVWSSYRPDLYRLALDPMSVDLPEADAKIEGQPRGGFFDQRVFDPQQVESYLASQRESHR